MNPDTLSFIVKYVMQDSSLIFLTISKDGFILGANAFSEKLFGRPLAGHLLTDFFIDFGESGIFPLTSSDALHPLLINLTTQAGLPETFYFTFHSQGDKIYAIGESNTGEIFNLRKNLIEVNNELNNRTRDLHKKNAELNKLNQQKNEFLGIAAHDLRNPISIIMGYSSFLMEEVEEDLSDEQVQILKTIQGTSEFMLHLLNDLLDIAAIESGKLNLDVKLVDILALIKKNTGLNAVIASRKNIHIRVECFEEIPAIMIDESKIIQVLNNLITNAIKFSNPGTTISVKVFLAGDYVTIAVADQGPGIPPTELDHLFKPFQRTSVRATGGEKTTGLGLSIVHNIVLGHQGRIWIESKVGEGSTFYVSLPGKKEIWNKP